jgi:hypothetical protein
MQDYLIALILNEGEAYKTREGCKIILRKDAPSAVVRQMMSIYSIYRYCYILILIRKKLLHPPIVF